MFTKSPFKGGYDITIGTSERGENVDECDLKKVSSDKFKHILIVLEV